MGPFTLVASDRDHCHLASEVFASKVWQVCREFGYDEIMLPCNGFAETQFETFMMRVAMFPARIGHAMLMVKFDYQRFGKVDARRGIVNGLAESLGSEWIIWRLISTTTRVEEDSQYGAFSMILSRRSDTSDTYANYHREFEGIAQRCSQTLTTNESQVKVTLRHVAHIADPATTIRYIERTQSHDVFVSCANGDVEEVSPIVEQIEFQGLSAFFEQRQISRDEDASPQVTEGIRRCKEMILFASKASMDSVWVLSEIGMALQLGLKINVVIMPGMSKRDTRRLEGLVGPNASWHTHLDVEQAIDLIQGRVHDWTQYQ